METLKDFAEAVDRHVGPATYPVAVKLLKCLEELPEKAKRPKRDFGQPLMPCQGSALARRQGLSIAMIKEDFSLDCSCGLIVFGIVNSNKLLKKLHIMYGLESETPEAAINREKALFRLEYGKYIGVLFSPVREANFKPDMVMIYCNSAQAMSLIGAARYDDGYPLTPRITGSAVCSASIVQTVHTGKCGLSIPCDGDRVNAFAKDDEIVFSTPFKSLGSITRGLEAIAKAGTPSDPIMRIHFGMKSPLAKQYEQLRYSIEQQL